METDRTPVNAKNYRGASILQIRLFKSMLQIHVTDPNRVVTDPNRVVTEMLQIRVHITDPCYRSSEEGASGVWGLKSSGICSWGRSITPDLASRLAYVAGSATRLSHFPGIIIIMIITNLYIYMIKINQHIHIYIYIYINYIHISVVDRREWSSYNILSVPTNKIMFWSRRHVVRWAFKETNRRVEGSFCCWTTGKGSHERNTFADTGTMSPGDSRQSPELPPHRREKALEGTIGSFRNFKSQNFKLSVSNPKSKYVAYSSVLSQISNCQSLGRKNKLEFLKTDRRIG